MKYELVSTKLFNKWFASLKDPVSKRKILARLARVENGHFGDCKQIGNSLDEDIKGFLQESANTGDVSDLFTL